MSGKLFLGKDSTVINTVVSTIFSATNYKIITNFITDHKQVNLDLTFNRIKKGRGYYKFNNILLTDQKNFFSLKPCYYRTLYK